MIEVNLIPGGKKRSAKRKGKKPSFSLPAFGTGPLRDRWTLGAVAVWVVTVLTVVFVFFSVSSQQEEVDVAVQTEVQDSARFAELISQVETLIDRRDAIVQRVGIIQEIDSERYVWPHVLDEVARALPDYTWLTSLVQTSPPPNLQISLTGQAGNNFAVAEFMDRLSQSPYIRVADLVSSSQTVQTQGSGQQQLVFEFVLDVYFQEPPPELVETVPLFDEDFASSPGS